MGTRKIKMINFKQLNDDAFTNLCRDILRGLGMEGADDFPAESSEKTFRIGRVLRSLGMKNVDKFSANGTEKTFRIKLIRESTDGMFRADDIWLCAFSRTDDQLESIQIQALAQATIAAGVGNLLLIVFGKFTPDAEAELRETLAAEKVQVALLTGSLAETLAVDYGGASEFKSQSTSERFSFASLRQYAQTQVETASWHKHFQTTSLQPMRVLPLHDSEDSVLAEADLFRALQGGSFLLLGEPGAGKTTNLLALAGEMGARGGLMPVFLPLGRYQGDFLQILGEALMPNAEPLSSKTVAMALLSSGALILFLDGINEVQNPDLQSQLVNELNDLTNPERPTAYSRWIVSGRVHDYQQSHSHLIHLESRRWEMQSLTADLIFRFLADALGETKGKALYSDLGEAVREICANPLLLTMVLTVYQETGHAPSGRGALYRQFVDSLLQWGSERDLGADKRKELETLLHKQLTEVDYQALAQKALTTLAAAMSTTMIRWLDARQQFIDTMSQVDEPLKAKAATLLLEILVERGILRQDSFHRVSFFHHTFQEYFQARNLSKQTVEELIPKSGVPAARREAVIFLAGSQSDPTPFVKRALNIDLGLSFDIVRDTHKTVSSDTTYQLAKNLWKRKLSGSSVIGHNRRWALRFRRLARLLGKTVEELAAKIDSHLNEVDKTGHLMKFYAELGDAKAQQNALKQAMTDDEIPEYLLFRAAQAAHDSGENERVVELYTRYLEKHPNSAAAFNNRGLAYKRLGSKEDALADYKRAVEVELSGNASQHHNLATLLYDLEQRDEARKHIDLALEDDPTYANAHSTLADWLESEDPETALKHCEQAVRYAPHDEDLRLYYSELATLQEKLDRYADAIHSLRQMITLNPTSSQIKSWKQRIAKLRQALDTQERTRTARERLQERGELPLPTLVVEWLRAAELTVTRATSTDFLAEGKGLQGKLPVALMPEPVVTAPNLRVAIDSMPKPMQNAQQIIIVTAAETLSLEARHQLAALQEEQTVALITAIEIRDALLQSDRNCRQLLDASLQRAGQMDNPFDYKGVVREPTEFFGRRTEFDELTGLISKGQSVGLYGIHKIGKSSLLEQLRRKLHISHPQITVIKIELDPSLREASDFYWAVLKQLPSLTELPQMQNVSSSQFRKTLLDFHKRRQQEYINHNLLIMLDEYAYLIPDRRGKGGLQNFIEVLGSLKVLHQEGWLFILPCGRTAALNRQASWGEDENPFIDLLHPRFLEPLPREENDALLTTLGVKARLTFTPEALSAIYVETGGHPAFSRALGSLILRDGQGEVTEDRVNQAVNKFLKDQDQSAILRAIYEERLDEDEKILAQKLATEGPQPRKALFPTDASIEQRRQIRDALANLIDTSVLIEQADEKIAHRYGLMRSVIRQEMEELGLC